VTSGLLFLVSVGAEGFKTTLIRARLIEGDCMVKRGGGNFEEIKATLFRACDI